MVASLNVFLTTIAQMIINVKEISVPGFACQELAASMPIALPATTELTARALLGIMAILMSDAPEKSPKFVLPPLFPSTHAFQAHVAPMPNVIPVENALSAPAQ